MPLSIENEGDIGLNKATLTRILTVVLLLAACTLVFVLNAAGKLPFLNTTPTTSAGSNESDEYIDTDESEAEESKDTSSDESTNTSNPEGDPVDEALEALKNQNGDGLSLSDGVFKKGEDVLTLVGTIAPLGENETVLARMGYIIKTTVTTDEDGDELEKHTLFNERGEFIMELEDHTFAGVRDELDRPLFKKGKKYYYLDHATLEFIETEYTEGGNGRGVEFDYPSYYGRYQDDVTYRKKRSGQWGIYNPEDEDYIIYPYRDMVFTFNGNPVACAYDDDSSKLRFYRLNTSVMTDKFYKPKTNGIESIGYYHFIDGLTRVRRVYSENDTRVSVEELMYTDGTLFNLPSDFVVRGYSDSMILLERDGKFGYMRSNGEWLTNPDFDYAAPFLEGLAVVGKNGKYGVITTDGSFVIPMVFNSIDNCSGGVILITMENGEKHIVNKLSEVIVPEPDADESEIEVEL